MKRSNWQDFRWQLVDAGPLTPALNVALDDVLLDQVAAGRREPTLRMWEWPSSSVVIGRFQSLRNEVDQEAARRLGVGVVRRISGGGAMFMEPGNIITYSVYAPASLVAGMSMQQSYAYLDAWVIDALHALGIDARYEPLNDITSPIGKIAGAAQARRGPAVLHHVTMAYDMDTSRMVQVLRIGREKLSDKAIQSAAKRVDPLRSQTGLSREAIMQKMVGVFRDQHGLAEGLLTAQELQDAKRLVENKFGTDGWTAVVP